MFCYSSTDPKAKNATVLYDYNNDEDNLWSRNSTANPLPPCSASWPQDHPCDVCLHDQTVYGMCRDLTDKVKMMMESGADSVDIFKAGCPALPPTPAPPEDAQQWPLIIGVTILLLLIFIGVFLYCKCYKNRKVQTRVENQRNPQEVMEMTPMTAEASEENHVNGINGSQQHPNVQV